MVITPSGREPGTSRAERGRSRQPVASITAAGSSVSRPPRPRELERPAGRPARDHRLGAQLGARGRRELGVAARVARAGERPAQVAQAEALMLRVTRDPAGAASRSSTSTSATPRRRSSSAAASPAGPAADDHDRPPLIRAACLEQLGELGAAEEALAAAHVRARAAAQPVEVHGGQRPVQRVADLAARDALAEADDPPVVAVGVDQLAALVRAARSARRCSAWRTRAAARPSARAAVPAAPSSSRTCSAIAIEADRPVERMPPTQA